ncbi:hypothetical protein [Nakamurella endophytica]|nr:hypothetical protein [Nakamurella endophytica]
MAGGTEPEPPPDDEPDVADEPDAIEEPDDAPLDEGADAELDISEDEEELLLDEVEPDVLAPLFCPVEQAESSRAAPASALTATT